MGEGFESGEFVVFVDGLFGEGAVLFFELGLGGGDEAVEFGDGFPPGSGFVAGNMGEVARSIHVKLYKIYCYQLIIYLLLYLMRSNSHR